MKTIQTCLLATLSLVLTTSCREQVPSPEALTADTIVTRSIEASGGDAYRDSRVRFTFRERTYRYYRDGDQRVYERETVTDSGALRDILKGSSFTRLLDSVEIPLPDSLQTLFGNSVNSGHYFAYLPYGLKDPAAKRELLGEVELEGSRYYKIRVTFDQQGGGDDFEDVFVYWFNTKTLFPDYLAYLYHTNGGGLRFRKGYNPRVVGGLRFQDYINYKAEMGTPVAALDSLYAAGSLEEVSRIELSDIEVTPGNYN